ncbi:NADP-dependent oxidoreductase [Sphingomonas deserti]|uniref:NADP-dependent oxidoreductase n=1 Tax=Allosphingosinicella deserti TaxID=2116704 RepID=A0A2P7R0A7_9SPHN|nr:NADP-dependent oxidoreductase [Sphingomonas deserti]
MNRQLRVRARPSGPVEDRHFELRTGPVPELAEGEALIRVDWLGIDPTQRTWLNPSATYVQPVALGEVMRGSGVGQVVRSRSQLYRVGDWVYGLTGWQDYVVARESGVGGLNVAPPGVEPRAFLSVLGVNGLTAYFGMTRVAQAQTGKSVFVSAAAGITGSIAGQIAQINGCHVIGSAGGPAKAKWVREVAGLDGCVDYKSEDLAAGLKAFAPSGLDIVFDSVGGNVLEAALGAIAPHAHVVLNGSISSGYGEKSYGAGPANYMELAFKRAKMEGFIFLDFLAEFPEAFADLTSWLAQGLIQFEETIAEGLASAPRALQGLFEGRNIGKQLVRVASDRDDELALALQ